jgi:DNA-binding MarR family transcriptional regulator
MTGEHASTAAVAAEVGLAVGALTRRMRQLPVAGSLPAAESLVVAHLARTAAVTSADLARTDNISPQSMGVIVASLIRRGLVRRDPDPTDGRRSLLSLTPAGRRRAADKRNARTDQIAAALSTGFTAAELDLLHQAAPLLERLAASLQ